jgi:iron complex transport system substrate-binding protein
MNTPQPTDRRARRPLRYALAVVGLAVGLAACGSDDDAADAPPATDAAAPADTGGETTTADTAAPADTTDTADTAAADDTTGGGAAADAFPVTVEHTYGSTTIDAEPLRVVSIGFSDQDFILALGVQPIAVREWYGEQPFATWPWAQDELGDNEPEVLPSTELNFEQIASLQPDLIIGVSSGMTDTEYETLTQIAPTIAQPGGFINYGTPWDAAMQQIGDALGRGEQASAIIDETKALFEAARAEHPEFEGKTAGVTFLFEEQPGAYASGDSRSRFLTDLGFVIPEEYDELAGEQFYFSISQEELDTLDTDVIVWLGTDDATTASIAGIPLRPSTRAYAEGREVVADSLLTGAFSFASPLSLEYVLDQLVPELALAVDGDPATAVPSAAAIAVDGAAPPDTTETDDDPAAALDGDQQAAADAWTAVFDSSVAFDDKAAHLEDADALAATIDAYAQAGSAMGGITLDPTAVEVDGDTATITYDVLFGGTAAYTDQTGTMTLVDGLWVVSRDEFCGFMASARNACPA